MEFLLSTNVNGSNRKSHRMIAYLSGIYAGGLTLRCHQSFDFDYDCYDIYYNCQIVKSKIDFYFKYLAYKNVEPNTKIKVTRSTLRQC